MLTEREYVEQQRTLGRRIHKHEGIDWEEVRPGYCKPAFIYKVLDCGTARPSRWHGWLGYSHQVPTPDQANRFVPAMVLERKQLDNFGMSHLPSKKRNNVRRALENCEVRLLRDFEGHLERLREINLSQALRHDQREGAMVPPARYSGEADSWRRQMQCEAGLQGREWWAAFREGVLLAYLRTFQVDDIRVIQQAKADSAFLKWYPMDALYFSVLKQAAADPACQRIINGRPQHAGLNHYKEQFLFHEKTLPFFSSHAVLVEWGKAWVRRRQRRARLRKHPPLDQDGVKFLKPEIA